MLSCDLSLITMHISDCCQFSDIHISQGSVATYLRCGGIFKYEFVANLPVSLPVKEFWKSVNIWGSYGQEFSVLFLFETQCRVVVGACVPSASVFWDSWFDLLSPFLSESRLFICNFRFGLHSDPFQYDPKEDLACVGDKSNCSVICTLFKIAFLGKWDERGERPFLCPLTSFPDRHTLGWSKKANTRFISAITSANEHRF